MTLDGSVLRLIRDHGSEVTFIVHIGVLKDVVWLERVGLKLLVNQR